MSKVLVAEDDKFLKQVYINKLPKEGFEVELATDGETALEKVKSFKPDLIILDIMMPKMNGLEVLEKLKESPEYKNIPVIITSNLDKNNDVKKGLDLGAVDYMIKSDVSINDIVDNIRKHLSESKAKDST